MRTAKAYAKLNLALVVGPLRRDGKHEVVTVLQAIDLCDDVELEPFETLAVEGFPEDTLVRAALSALAQAAGVEPGWRVRLRKRIPVAAGLAGGSSDAAAALRLANALLPRSLPPEEVHRIASGIGADVPFFLREGPQLGRGDGSALAPLELPGDYAVLLVLPDGQEKRSTGDVYRRFDERGGGAGFESRCSKLLDALARVERASDLAALPYNDLASSPLADALRELDAFRADVSGAGPVAYGLFERDEAAKRAAERLEKAGQVWLARPLGGP